VELVITILPFVVWEWFGYSWGTKRFRYSKHKWIAL